MALCGITQGFDVDCAALKKVSGVKKVWLYNLDNLVTPIDGELAGYLSSLELSGYTGLYPFESKKFSHQLTSTLSVNEDGNASWTQALVLRLFNNSPEEDTVLADLAVSNIGAVVWTNANEFLIAGAANGLSATEGSVGTGRNLGESTVANITLTGQEQKPWIRFLRTDVNTTIAYLNALAA